MTYRLEVFERSGRPIAELDRLQGVRWSTALNKSGQLVFDISASHPKATANILRQFNIVLLTHDELEPWGGYIQNPQWPSSGDVITVTCAQVQQRLGLRRSDVARYEKRKPEEIYSALLMQANRDEHTGLYVGSMATGSPIDFELRRENVYDKLQEFLEKAQMEWYVEYINPTTWVANLVTTTERDLTASVFVQGGYDTEGLPDYNEETTELANRIWGVGKLPEGYEVPEGEDDYAYRPTYKYEDQVSRVHYGLVEDAVEFDTEDQATLERLTREEVQKRANPKTIISFSINKRRGLWSQFRDGDIIAVQLPRYGYTGLAVPVRVLGREIDDAGGTMTIAAETVQGAKASTLDMYKFMHYGTQEGLETWEPEYADGA